MNGIKLTDNLNSENNWKKFLTAIEHFSDSSTSHRILPDIYNDGLNVFSKLPQYSKSALFTLNDSTPEFQIRIADPNSDNLFFNDLYNHLVDSGHIGIALDTATVINVNVGDYSEVGGSVLVVPIRKSRGINGIVLVVHFNDSEDFNQLLTKLCSIFANLLGNTIENHVYMNEIGHAKTILEQKIATRTLDLAQSRREMKAMFDSVLTGVMVFDLSICKIVRVNPVACDLIGLKDSEIVGRSTIDFLRFTNYDDIHEANGVPLQQYYDSELMLKNGKTLAILRNTTKLRLNNRVLITESFIDISKIKEAELALTKTNELLELKVQERTEDLQIVVHKLKQEIIERENAEAELLKLFEHQKELAELKTRFVSMVSHEFRTPLTIIKSSAQMIDKFNKQLCDEEKEYYCHRVIKSVDNLTDLIENVVFIGKSDANKLEVKNVEINLKQLIESIITDLRVGMNEDRNFAVNIQEGLCNIISDDTLLHLILSNLISNANKYSDSKNDIIINAEINNDILMISVEDFGIGIPDEDQNSIFDLFYRSKNVSTINGTGLGLAVVKESLSKLGANIEMKSKLNIGSEFKVFIPLYSKMENE